MIWGKNISGNHQNIFIICVKNSRPWWNLKYVERDKELDWEMFYTMFYWQSHLAHSCAISSFNGTSGMQLQDGFLKPNFQIMKHSCSTFRSNNTCTIWNIYIIIYILYTVYIPVPSISTGSVSSWVLGLRFHTPLSGAKTSAAAGLPKPRSK